MSYAVRTIPAFSAINKPTNRLCILPAGVVDLGGVDIDVRGHRFVNKRAETQPKVRGVLCHTKRQRYAHCLQLDHRENAEGGG